MLKKIFKLADNKDSDSLASKMREKRLESFFKLLGAFSKPPKILDVGGTSEFWKHHSHRLQPGSQITLLNIYPENDVKIANLTSIGGDARKLLGIDDNQFDVCFSNSVIEHVGTLYDQISMANEINRVARAYFIQTPYRYFPIEPHFLFPTWNFLPRFVRALLLSRFDLGWMKKTGDFFLATAEVEQVRLLNIREMRRLFPAAEIQQEMFGPFVKSLIAVKGGGAR